MVIMVVAITIVLVLPFTKRRQVRCEGKKVFVGVKLHAGGSARISQKLPYRIVSYRFVRALAIPETIAYTKPLKRGIYE